MLQKLIVIGEAAARLPQEFKDQHPITEWRDVVAFRNILVHSYFSVKRYYSGYRRSQANEFAAELEKRPQALVDRP